jgi:hypothetical protein
MVGPAQSSSELFVASDDFFILSVLHVGSSDDSASSEIPLWGRPQWFE